MTKHARLGASGAHRWMRCPGSIRMAEGLPDKTSSYAREGSAAHAVAEECLKKDKDADELIGKKVEGVLVTEEMVRSVQRYLDYVRERSGGCELLVEQTFTLDRLSPPEPMFGTADATFFKDGTLTVVDYKHGAGVAVEIEGNAQLRYYGLAAMTSLGYPATSIEMVIVQPRARHVDGPIRCETISASELMAWSKELMAAADAALEPDAPLVAGSWCRWCPASAACPELQEQAMASAQVDFADTVETMPPVERMSLLQCAEALRQGELLEIWLREVRSHLRDELISGKDAPGWMLVPKRAARRWISEDALLGWANLNGMDDAKLFNSPVLKTPAQLEKRLGKGNLPDDLIEAVSPGWNLVPA
jgi:hypothetical protein